MKQLTQDRSQQWGLNRRRLRKSHLCLLSHRPAPLMVQSFSYTAAIVTQPILYTYTNKTHSHIELKLIPCRPLNTLSQMLLCVVEHLFRTVQTFCLCPLSLSSDVCFSGWFLYEILEMTNVSTKWTVWNTILHRSFNQSRSRLNLNEIYYTFFYVLHSFCCTFNLMSMSVLFI